MVDTQKKALDFELCVRDYGAIPPFVWIIMLTNNGHTCTSREKNRECLLDIDERERER